MKALKVDGEILAIWTKTEPLPALSRLGKIVDVEPCPVCHGLQYVEKEDKGKKRIK